MGKPCWKCGSRNWEKNRDGYYLTVACGSCGNSFEVELPEAIQEGGKCRDCFGDLITKEAKIKKRKLEKNYYYTHYLECNRCKKKYWLEKHKVFNTGSHILDLVILEKHKPLVKTNNGRPKKVRKNKTDNWVQPWRNKSDVKRPIFPEGYWANGYGKDN